MTALPPLAPVLGRLFAMFLLDGAKALSHDVLDLLEDRLRPGAFIVAETTPITAPAA